MSKRETDLARVEGSIARVEGRLDAAVEEHKALIQGLTLQNNDLRSHGPEVGDNRGSILGHPRGQQDENFDSVLSAHSFKYATKLKFPQFNGEGVDNWLFKIK